MPEGHDTVAIGASSGGIEALRRLLADLPADLPAAVLVVVHLSDEAPSALARILDRAGPLEAKNPKDGEKVQKGRVYVARPDHHLLLEDGRVRLTRCFARRPSRAAPASSAWSSAGRATTARRGFSP